jgi:hypothetical protein
MGLGLPDGPWTSRWALDFQLLVGPIESVWQERSRESSLPFVVRSFHQSGVECHWILLDSRSFPILDPHFADCDCYSPVHSSRVRPDMGCFSGCNSSGAPLHPVRTSVQENSWMSSRATAVLIHILRMIFLKQHAKGCQGLLSFCHGGAA